MPNRKTLASFVAAASALFLTAAPVRAQSETKKPNADTLYEGQFIPIETLGFYLKFAKGGYNACLDATVAINRVLPLSSSNCRKEIWEMLPHMNDYDKQREANSIRGTFGGWDGEPGYWNYADFDECRARAHAFTSSSPDFWAECRRPDGSGMAINHKRERVLARR
ncbi:MAG: hypothetical protein SFW62_03635 [Alphaproteobacteria bacterium]|nr:hypothetical protein [Alphaproteobacteria bacterium]